MKKTLLFFLLLFTNYFYAQVTSITTCGSSPFNLTSLNSDFIGNLNPSETTVSYFLSFDDATNNTNEIANPTNYYGPEGPTKIYGRVNNNGTITVDYFDLSVHLPVTATASNIPILCKGATTSLTINTVPAGTYYSSLNGGAFTTNTTYNNLTAGVYNIKVQTKNPICPDFTFSYTITEPAALNATAMISNQNAIITATGGTLPYVYSFDGMNYQTANIFPNITPGNHVFFVRDSNGCVTTVPLTVLPSLDVAVAITKEVDCITGASITINAVGGQPQYSYSIDGGVHYQAQNTFINIPAGTYTIKVIDAANTVSNGTPITINPPSPIAVNTTIKPIDCISNAIITVLATGGQGPYFYSLDGGITYTSNNTFSNIPAGTYRVAVKDQKNCISSFLNVIIQSFSPLSATASNTQLLCAKDKSTLTINANGGQFPYQYALDNNPYTVSNVYPNLSAGTYTVRVKDANNCLYTLVSNIVQPTPIYPDILIQGQTLTLNGQAGTAPYEYSVDFAAYQTGNVFSNLSPGIHTVRLKDSKGCESFDFSVRIEDIQALTSMAVITKTLDCVSNATITVTAAGGQSPYTFSANGGTTYQSSNVFPNLVAGTYNIIVKDAANTISNANTIVINPLVQLVATVAITKTLDCKGDASFKATVTGGTAPYQYSMNNGTYSAINIFYVPTAGNYTVNIRDSAGCVVQKVINIAPYSPISISNMITNVTCPGDNNGSIRVLASSGVSPYTYSIGSAYQASNLFSNLVAGNYVVSVKDKQGCVRVLPAVITQPSALAITTTITNVTCSSSATGAIDVTASGGTAPYSYSIDGISYSSNKTFTSLTTGVYTLYVKDSKGCTASYSATISPPAALVLDVDIKSLNNDGSIGGYIKLNTSGGKAPYLYSVRNDTRGVQVSLNQNIRFYSGMTEGSYTISVTDANGCQTTSSNVIVAITNPIILNAVKTPISCVKNASLVVNASGGVAPYLYSYDGGVTYTSNNPGKTNLTPGNYSILLKDAIGNEAQSHFIVKAYVPVQTTATVTYETADGYVDGVITMSSSNGVAPYTYKVQDSATGKVIFDNSLSVGYVGLPEGTYSITAKDANGCESQSVDATLVLPGPISISISNVTPITCEEPGESLTLNASGGTAPYLYSFNAGVTYRTFNSVANLQSGGNYIFYAKDALGNTSRITYKVKTYVPLTLDLTKTDVNCNGAQDGTIVANVAGGTAPYTYSLGTVFTSSKVFNNLPAGTYNVSVKDAVGCTTISSITIAQPTILAVSTSVVNATTTNDGKITVTAFGGNLPYTYSLQNSNGTIVIPTQASNVFTDLTPGSYTVKVTDSRGCIFLQSGVNVITPSPLVATYTIIPISCDNPAIIAVVAAGGTAPYTYSFDNGVTYTASNLFSTFTPGNYEIKVRDAQNNITSLVAVLSPLNPLSIVVRIVTPVNCSQNGIIEAIVSGGSAPYDYSINGGPFQTSNVFNVPAGFHIISARDVNGCSVMIAIESKQPEPLVASLNVEAHTATITVTGGLAPYLYAISPNLNAFTANNTFTNLEVGTYSAIVQDASGCYVILDFAIEPPAPLIEGKNAITVEFKPGQTLADLIVEGENIQWYSSQNPSGGKNSKTNETPLPLTTVLVNGVTYYASQTINGVESKERLAVTAKSNGSLSTPDFVLPNFKYYPNPVKHVLTINNTSLIDEIEIYAVSGAAVLSKKIDSDHADIDLSNVSSGFYFLKVKAEGQVKIVKLVKK